MFIIALQKFLFLIVTMVGPDLQRLQSQQQGKKFALNTALRIGEQTLAAIRDMHRVGTNKNRHLQF